MVLVDWGWYPWPIMNCIILSWTSLSSFLCCASFSSCLSSNYKRFSSSCISQRSLSWTYKINSLVAEVSFLSPFDLLRFLCWGAKGVPERELLGVSLDDPVPEGWISSNSWSELFSLSSGWGSPAVSAAGSSPAWTQGRVQRQVSGGGALGWKHIYSHSCSGAFRFILDFVAGQQSYSIHAAF